MVVLNKEKEIEFLINWNLNLIKIFKDDFNFEKIFEALSSLPADLNTKDIFQQGNDIWILSEGFAFQNITRGKMVKIQQLTNNRKEEFIFHSLTEFVVLGSDWPMYNCSLLERTVKDGYNKIIQRDKIYIKKHPHGKTKLIFSQQKKNGIEKVLSKEIDLEKFISDIKEIAKKLTDKEKTPTL